MQRKLCVDLIGGLFVKGFTNTIEVVEGLLDIAGRQYVAYLSEVFPHFVLLQRHGLSLAAFIAHFIQIHLQNFLP